MKLLITIVQDQDANRLMECLTEEGVQFTKISSTGGFLRAGNTTLLIGIEKEKVNRVRSLIEEACNARELQVDLPASMAGMGGAQALLPTRVTVGGAIIFVLDVERILSF